MKINEKAIRPYGDTLDDGKVQLSFTLPLPLSPKSESAARQLARNMGIEDLCVVHSRDMGEGFSFFILYGRCTHKVDFSTIEVAQLKSRVMDFYEINDYIREHIGRKVVVVGACTGSDAHTVGLDAIMNMKGYAGEYGLERYPEIEAYNLGSQIINQELIRKAVELKADAILVSQVVTQKNVHISNLTELAELIETKGLRDRVLLLLGGPRINHELALELGFDAGFGTGTLPSDVAGYIVQTLGERNR